MNLVEATRNPIEISTRRLDKLLLCISPKQDLMEMLDY